MAFTTRPELRGTFGWWPRRTGSRRRPGWRCSSAAATRSTPRWRPGSRCRSSSPHERAGGRSAAAVLRTGRRACCAGRGRRRPRRRWRRFARWGWTGARARATSPRASRARSTRGCAAARLRDGGARRRARVRDRLRARRFPATPGIVRAIAGARTAWDDVAALWASRVGARLRNPLLADTYARLARSRRGDARGADRRRPRRLVPRVGGRGDRRRGRRAGDGQLGRGHAGVLSGDDLAAFRRRRGAGLARLRRLDGVQDRAVGPGAGVPAAAGAARRARARARSSASSTCTRCSRARSSRSRIGRRGTGTRRRSRSTTLLSRAYADARRALVGAEASGELRPGLGGRLPSVRGGGAGRAPARRADPRRHLPPRRRRPLRQPRLGHAERWLAAELARDPGLGFCLGTRAQMFWLEDGPAGVAGRRPAAADDAVAVAGAARRRHGAGLRHARRRPAGPVVAGVLPRPRVFGLNLQAAIDAPMFHRRTSRARSTRARRCRGGWRSRARAGGDDRGAARARARRGRDRGLVAGAAVRDLALADGVLRAAANPRGMQGYAVGR